MKKIVLTSFFTSTISLPTSRMHFPFSAQITVPNYFLSFISRILFPCVTLLKQIERLSVWTMITSRIYNHDYTTYSWKRPQNLSKSSLASPCMSELVGCSLLGCIVLDLDRFYQSSSNQFSINATQSITVIFGILVHLM